MDHISFERGCTSKVRAIRNDGDMPEAQPLVILRPYQENEFEQACVIREITNPEKREKFRDRFMLSGKWFDHYLHLAIEAD